MSVRRFFENDKGELKVLQPPNLLLSLWGIVQVISIAGFHSKQPALSTLASMLLFAWSYNELTQGESPFRKTLGGLILSAIIVNLYMRWQ